MSETERGTLSTDGIWKNRLELYKAALGNDWKKAETIYKKPPGMEYGVIITPRGETALHVAALAGHTRFVKNLVEKMNEDEIRTQMVPKRTSPTHENDEHTHENRRGNTAFHCAAISGNVKIAEAILMKHNKLCDLATTRGFGNDFPIYMAAVKGNKKMVRYLYKATKHELEDDNRSDLDEDRRTLLLTLINSDIYDVALQMTKALLNKRTPKLMEEDALEALAHKPISHPKFWDKFFATTVVGELIEILWDEIANDESRVTAMIKAKDGNVILEAAKRGNFKFLSILIASYPDVLFTYDDNNYTIFHHAILNRHMDIFKLIRIGSVKTVVTTFRDSEDNNMLHLSAKLAPQNQLNIVPGAALQLQLELLWFKEVKKVMEPHEVNRKIQLTRNDMSTPHEFIIKEHIMAAAFAAAITVPGGNVDDVDDYQHFVSEKLVKVSKFMKQFELNQNNNLKEEYTPHELFIKEHKDLMEEGEKWMRDTANSCMIVAALITTIAFAAAITVPGGNADDGYPNFLTEILFQVFAISDSISLVSSATSLLSFLSILTARYTVDDFRWSLPNKLFIGLLTLFVSVVAMMVAFVLSIVIIFENRTPLVGTILIIVASSVPISLFIWQHLSLFVDVFVSTYTSRLLFKSKEDPNLLIKEKKKRLKSFLSLRACGKAIIDC